MKKEIMPIERKSGRARNIRLPAWTNILIPEDEYNRDGITQKAIKRELLAAGKKVRRDYYDFEDYGWFPMFEICGSVFEENGKLLKEIDGQLEEVTVAQVAYWRTMSLINKGNGALIIH